VPKNRISIIVLNWNGWADTVECLASLYNQSDYGFDIVLIDNNSQDDSIEKIRRWAQKPEWVEKSSFNNLRNRTLPDTLALYECDDLENCALPASTGVPRLILIKNSENSGFASASNLGIRFAHSHLKSAFYFLLNNDTFVHPEAVQHLRRHALSEQNRFAAFQAAIYYYDVPQRIWHVGGRILPWIQTRYFRTDTKSELRLTQSLSGCALFLPKSTVETFGFLSEKFFHGEEDLNYSLRLLKAHEKSAIITGARVYHKISKSSDKQWKNVSQRFINASLNRFVNARMFYSKPKWQIWRIGTSVYYFALLVFKYRQDVYNSVKLMKLIFFHSSRIEKVDRNIIEKIMDKHV